MKSPTAGQNYLSVNVLPFRILLRLAALIMSAPCLKIVFYIPAQAIQRHPRVILLLKCNLLFAPSLPGVAGCGVKRAKY